jgi:NitT/TauT family transport system substrate-binding protein
LNSGEIVMQIIQNRRDFLTSFSAAGTVGLLSPRTALAAEPAPETTTVRIAKLPAICLAPGYVADDLLRAEGFDDVRYVAAPAGLTMNEMIGRGEIDFGLGFVAGLVHALDAGTPLTALAGIHSGCFELFAHDPIRTISDLRGKRVGIHHIANHSHLYVAIMANHVGLDPYADIEWVTSESGNTLELFAEGKVDAYLGFPPEPQELRARNIGRVIIDTATVKPWSQYLCCMVYGRREFVHDHPAATKRFLRAVLKAADFCAADPERAAQRLVDGGFTPSYAYALQTLSEVPYDRWREYDAEDTMRFFALRLHQVGMITSSPNALLAAGTDWRFLSELRRELKA